MIIIQDIYDFIDDFAPFSTQLDFDNAGLQIGHLKNGVTGVTVCLDVTQEAVAYAAQQECELIISHHPLIFHPLRTISSKSTEYLLCRLGISLISAHTNLDAASGGINDQLCDLLGLAEVRPLKAGAEDAVAMMRLGVLPQITTEQKLAQQVQAVLGSGVVRFTETKKPIDTVAVCTGAGGEYWEAAQKAGAQALITGEARHHELLGAQQADFCLMEAGHYATENIMVKKLSEMLSARFRDLRVFAYEGNDPASYQLVK